MSYQGCKDHWFPGFVSQDLMSSEGFQDHWFLEFSVPGPDVRLGFSGPLVLWI